jgi:2-keto-4-pentenoate hydratase/2-oxohepta-3-ene-1,7-dioic acid hydratase in catechol pathway
MRFGTVTVSGQTRPVALHPDGELSDLRTAGFDSVRDLVEAGPAALASVSAALSGSTPIGTIDEVTAYLPPIPVTRRNLFCVGSNYRKHTEEGDRPKGEVPSVPTVFTKPYTGLSGHMAQVPLHPSATSKVDWEAEIVVIIGMAGRDIPEASALDHVFGYTLGNDVSARDLQRSGGDSRSQWFKGKSLDGHAPMGPFIVTADELGSPPSIDVELNTNSVPRQKFNSNDMTHSVSVIISYLSQGMNLLAGDVIFTGTSSGVGLWADPPTFLRDRDVVEITSPQLGTLTNVFVAGEVA